MDKSHTENNKGVRNYEGRMTEYKLCLVPEAKH